MSLIRLSSLGVFVILVFGFAGSAVSSDVYDDSGVLRPEYVNDAAAVEAGDFPVSTTPPAGEAWGIASFSAYNLAAGDFRPRMDSELNFSGSDYSIYHTAGNYFYDAAFHVPTGALVTGVTPWYYDDDADEEFWFWIHDSLYISGSASATEVHSFTSTGTPGYSATYMAFASPLTAYNYDQSVFGAHFYNVLIRLGSGTAGFSVRFGGMNVWYLRQISPAPGTATFSDVPTGHSFFQQIEALVDSGITAGCGGGNYCPNNPVTRGQMAVFLAKALGLHYPDSG
jgi:hypothetical protein